MEKPFQNIIKSCFEEHVKRMEKLRDLNEIIRKVDRERKPIPDKTPSLADLGRDGLPETLLRKMGENEDEEEETLSSAAKGEANGGITKRSSEKTSTHSNGSEREDEFGEALEKMMKEVEKNCRERRRAISDKPSSSSQNKDLKMAGGKLSALGMGGIGETIIHNNGTTINFTFGTIQMRNHNYYKHEMDEEEDADEQ